MRQLSHDTKTCSASTRYVSVWNENQDRHSVWPSYTIKVTCGSEGKLLYILKFDMSWKWVVSFVLHLFNP
jgi:hypothetical protein